MPPGADYKYSRAYGLYFPTGSGAVAAGSTRYFTYSVHVGAVPTVRVTMMHDAILSHMIADAVLAAGAGESFTYTLLVNGIATAVTCQTAGAVDTQSEDIVNQVAVVRGDNIVMRIVATGAAAGTSHSVGLMVKRI